ncbi:MAG: sigma-70 family RNA polymerase sigma factor [Ilumatobacter sp.]|nr:sigma-70 family RNA polymerase sigma factor [Ilumatobacter sp.]
MTHDDDWFEELFRHHRPAVAAYCARRIGADDAADAVAQTFTTAWRRRHDVPDGDAAIRWLYGVARNVISHQYRSSSRGRRLAEKVGAQPRVAPPDPETTAVQHDDHRRVRDAVMTLAPNDREVLLLAAWEGLTHAEIGEVVGCSVSAVDKRVARAKRRLATRYERLAGRSALGGPAPVTELETRPGLTRSPVRAPKGGGAA